MDMKLNMKLNAGFFWVIGVIAASMVLFVYLVIVDAPQTQPKIKLSYFLDEREVVASVEKQLAQELSKANSFWIGIEPFRSEQIDIVVAIKKNFEQRNVFQKVFIDEELQLSNAEKEKLGMTDSLKLKEDALQLGEQLQALEKDNVPYLVVTAAIYSTSLLPSNPIHRIKEKFMIKPTTFSIGYFATTAEDEKNLLFECKAEDHSGIKDWGCFVTNRSRVVRRKIKEDNTKPWLGLMDLSGERDYAILIKKKI
jgi:hypothetical protein